MAAADTARSAGRGRRRRLSRHRQVVLAAAAASALVVAVMAVAAVATVAMVAVAAAASVVVVRPTAAHAAAGGAGWAGSLGGLAKGFSKLENYSSLMSVGDWSSLGPSGTTVGVVSDSFKALMGSARTDLWLIVNINH